jgi:DNA-binding transcriptional regulator YiaG
MMDAHEVWRAARASHAAEKGWRRVARTPRRRAAPYRTGPAWSGADVRALRLHLGVTQDELSRRLGMRQQTVSEWEVGKHRPRGASLTLLGVIAERAGFAYLADPPEARGGAERHDGHNTRDGQDGGAHGA